MTIPAHAGLPARHEDGSRTSSASTALVWEREGRADGHWRGAAELERARHARERRIDAEGEDSFPASDPPSHNGIIGPRLATARSKSKQGGTTGHLDLWRTEPGGGLAAEANGLRLSVHASGGLDGAVRFLVSRPDGGEDSRGILASGTEENARAAMKAAVRAAERILGRPFAAA